MILTDYFLPKIDLKVKTSVLTAITKTSLKLLQENRKRCSSSWLLKRKKYKSMFNVFSNENNFVNVSGSKKLNKTLIFSIF